MGPESFHEPVSLLGRYVHLVPLERSHGPGLAAAVGDPGLHRYLLEGPGASEGEMARLIDTLLARQASGTDLPFTTLRASDGRPVGMTRFLNIDRPNQAVEVGGTWLDPRHWRTPFNTESKYLLFRHAFEVEQVHRVYLKTDLRNDRAQRAIERVGARREAVLREHLLLAEGTYRSSVFYSLLAPEWRSVQRHLERLLARPWAEPR